MITIAPPRQSSRGAPTQEQLDLWNNCCRERDLDHLVLTHFPARYRYRDVNKLLDKLLEVPLPSGVVATKPDRALKKASNEQVAYIIRLQAQVGDPVGVPEDLLAVAAHKIIDRLKARREAA